MFLKIENILMILIYLKQNNINKTINKNSYKYY